MFSGALPGTFPGVCELGGKSRRGPEISTLGRKSIDPNVGVTSRGTVPPSTLIIAADALFADGVPDALAAMSAPPTAKLAMTAAAASAFAPPEAPPTAPAPAAWLSRAWPAGPAPEGTLEALALAPGPDGNDPGIRAQLAAGCTGAGTPAMP